MIPALRQDFAISKVWSGSDGTEDIHPLRHGTTTDVPFNGCAAAYISSRCIGHIELLDKRTAQLCEEA